MLKTDCLIVIVLFFPILWLVIDADLLLCPLYKLNFFTGERAWLQYYSQLQASAGGLGLCLPQIRGPQSF